MTDDEPEESHSFNSSLVADATYNKATQTLDVTLISGRNYTVEGFPVEKWAQFKSAWSPGRFFNTEIKGR